MVSHDCHSYLQITLTNGIPPRKAMVVAGENAANDVDEKVYDNDGNERNEAREASAGDRRAIADADQAGQLDISSKRITCSFEQWQRAKLSHVSHLWKRAQWSGDQLHVRPERWL